MVFLPPDSRSFTKTPFAIVDFPDPDNPVKNKVNPCFSLTGYAFCNSLTTSG